MNSIGELFRQERLRRGFDLSQIAEQTKINASLLQAIESDDLDKLPGVFFVRSFVRQYARALGLDENEFEPELDRLTNTEPPSPPEPPRERPRIDLPRISGEGIGSAFSGQRSLGSLFAFVLIVAACSAIYVLWQRTREAPKPAPSEPVAAVQQAAPPPSVAPANFSQPAPKPVAPAPPEAAPPQPAPALSTAPPGQPAAVRVELRATAPSWVHVIADEKHLFMGTLEPSQARTFESMQTMSVRTGNAGGLEVSWNGKAVGTAGPDGQIRILEFSPAEYKILLPPPPAPKPESAATPPPKPEATPAETPPPAATAPKPQPAPAEAQAPPQPAPQRPIQP